MALSKTTFVAHSSPPIGAQFLNALQDEVIDKCLTVEAKTFTAAQKEQARDNIGAIDESVATAKADGAKVLKLSTGSTTVSSLPYTFYDSRIKDSMECVHAVLSNPSAQAGDWTVTTSNDYNGYAQITGTISGSTTITIYLEKIMPSAS